MANLRLPLPAKEDRRSRMLPVLVMGAVLGVLALLVLTPFLIGR
ncbi:MAG: hypothetical protein ACMVO5_10135 [Polymorphobacter sp.]